MSKENDFFSQVYAIFNVQGQYFLSGFLFKTKNRSYFVVVTNILATKAKAF